MKYTYLFVILFFTQSIISQSYKKSEPFTHTYSIVAKDEITGEMGVAVQSHWFSVGTSVVYGEAGVGVVATQSLTNPAYGPKGLALLKQGLTPQQALDALIANDEGKGYRQVGMLDTNGNVATHTGDLCIAEAGHRQGKNYSVQANLMLNNTVWDAMANAFENSKGKPLSERLLITLKAAQAEKGDLRGKQSAAILIVSGTATGNSWEDTLMDLRVDDHKNPLQELERLMKVDKAYNFMNNGDVAMEEGNTKLAETQYLSAQKLFPNNLEMQYWYAINLLNNKDFKKANPILKSIFKQDNNWKLLIPRLVDSKLLTLTKAEVETVMKL